MDISMLNLASRFNSPPTSSSAPIFVNREGSGSVATPILTNRDEGKSVSTPVFTLEERNPIRDITDDFLLGTMGNSGSADDTRTIADADRDTSAPISESKPELSKSKAHNVFERLIERAALARGQDPAEFYAQIQRRLGIFEL
ncbi:hypothetical protein [Celeribacter sp. PS-C1]|uniref:hypothetical protein n=1 Tax=Celeribacter sp. PS-C1 TaxID=2820813 RepID=UPI001CA4F9AB|nr:hypothetical protein [Celeribacter sp. PS-C1]MBW6418461.1 hypothetical protein [Celeribacter sp. PS-C1]